MLPVSNRTERLATLIAIAVGWLLILSYLVMLLANLISALRDGATDNLLARTFSFAGIGVDQPWLEAYALANVVALIVLFSLATRAMLGGSLAACIPNHYSIVREAIDRGVPLDEVKPGNKITLQLKKLILPQSAAKTAAPQAQGAAKKFKLSWAR
jgi:hypothetical protein